MWYCTVTAKSNCIVSALHYETGPQKHTKPVKVSNEIILNRTFNITSHPVEISCYQTTQQCEFLYNTIDSINEKFRAWGTPESSLYVPVLLCAYYYAGNVNFRISYANLRDIIQIYFKIRIKCNTRTQYWDECVRFMPFTRIIQRTKKKKTPILRIRYRIFFELTKAKKKSIAIRI